MPKGTASGPSDPDLSRPRTANANRARERAGDHREEEDHTHLARAQPRGDGSGELHVAKAETLATPYQRVDPTQDEQGGRRRHGGDGPAQTEDQGGVPGIGCAAIELSPIAVARAIKNAKAEQRQGKGVRQLHGLGIASGQGYKQCAEDCDRASPEIEAENEQAAEDEHGDRGLDQRIPPGDAPQAVAATAAQQKEAEERDIVACAYGRLALRAVRGRPHDRTMAGQAADADVQKAAEGQAEEQREDNLDGQHCDGSSSKI